MSRKVPVGVRNTEFKIEGTPIKRLGDGDTMTFLGKPVGFLVFNDWNQLKAIMDTWQKILKSKRHPG